MASFQLETRHLDSVLHGVVQLESIKLFPEKCPTQPRGVIATQNFLHRFRLHRANLSRRHSVKTCKGCIGVLAVYEKLNRTLREADKRDDMNTVAVLYKAQETLAAAWSPSEPY
jgi:hypothetical protein